MNRETKPGRIELKMVQIPSPCSADWDAMDDHGKARHCAQCDHLVYDLSQFTKAEAEELINTSEKLPCLHCAFAPDGTPITKDYKPPFRTRIVWLAASLVALIAGGGSAQAQNSPTHGTKNVAKSKKAPQRGQPTCSTPTKKPTVKQTVKRTLGKIRIAPKLPQKPTAFVGEIAPTKVPMATTGISAIKPAPKPAPKKTKTKVVPKKK